MIQLWSRSHMVSVWTKSHYFWRKCQAVSFGSDTC